MAFGVKTANMFELLGDEDSAPVAPKAAPKAQADAKKPAPALSGAANVEARLKGGAVNGPANNANGRGNGRGGGRGRGRGGRGFGGDRQRDGGEGEGETGERAPRPYRGRGGGGRHFERGNRGYDRHDGTGRGHEVEKKGGHGGHNWGAPGDEETPVPEETSGAVWQEDPAEEQAPGTDAPVSAEAAAATGADEAAEPAEPEEPEKEEMTLDEYEKLQEEKRGALKKKPTTTAKVDTKAFEGMKAINRGEVEDNELGLSEKKQLGKSKSGGSDKVRKEKELLPTGFRVGSAEAGGRGRGRSDRGGRFSDRFGDRPERERPPRRTSDENGRGYGRGFGRGDRPFSGGRGRGRDGPPPTISDDTAFPTLGA